MNGFLDRFKIIALALIIGMSCIFTNSFGLAAKLSFTQQFSEKDLNLMLFSDEEIVPPYEDRPVKA